MPRPLDSPCRPCGNSAAGIAEPAGRGPRFPCEAGAPVPGSGLRSLSLPTAALQLRRIVPPRVPLWRADCTHCSGPAGRRLPDPPDRVACLPLPAAAQAMVCREGGWFLPSGRCCARHLPGLLHPDRSRLCLSSAYPVGMVSSGSRLRQPPGKGGPPSHSPGRFSFCLAPGALVPSGCGNLPGDVQQRDVSCSAFHAPAGQFQRQVKLQ